MCLFSFGQNNNFAELPMHYGGRAGARGRRSRNSWTAATWGPMREEWLVSMGEEAESSWTHMLNVSVLLLLFQQCQVTTHSHINILYIIRRTWLSWKPISQLESYKFHSVDTYFSSNTFYDVCMKIGICIHEYM